MGEWANLAGPDANKGEDWDRCARALDQGPGLVEQRHLPGVDPAWRAATDAVLNARRVANMQEDFALMGATPWEPSRCDALSRPYFAAALLPPSIPVPPELQAWVEAEQHGEVRFLYLADDGTWCKGPFPKAQRPEPEPGPLL